MTLRDFHTQLSNKAFIEEIVTLNHNLTGHKDGTEALWAFAL